ncbi:MAG TPA: hypothetical protein VJ692_14390 [Nitrospiraceae bacterium]|nr:hypothetical protein [Nitrospiraceae bacterium]
MNELTIWWGWYAMLVGIPVMVLALSVTDWIRRPAYQSHHRRRCVGVE